MALSKAGKCVGDAPMPAQKGIRREPFSAVGTGKGLEAWLARLAAVFLQLLLGGEALFARHAPVGALARVRAHVAHHGGSVDSRVVAELAHQARCRLLGRLGHCAGCVASCGRGVVSLLLQAKVVHHCVLPDKGLAADAAVKATAARRCLCRARRSCEEPTATPYRRARNGTEHLNTGAMSNPTVTSK